ncbi:glycosyltransferase family 2 protein [Cyanobium sp. ATX 6F1]|uniref:glycosyltransferase family 2 protein n=1 Tax=Cyanobium sp. ATX 6F1 TaxID=2823702 RepID=UPI0020CE4E01|nr:glycosyltransferase [Cyanobium sp. ATX 6F1]MCP9915849.1 glycosyltransferase [Cyanobium sp. ATX 6F1]
MISIVIPCFNASRYLSRLAETIAHISPFAGEILLVDDCSTDDSHQKAVALGLPIIQTPRNLGPGGARNYGVERLSGEWVHFLDADDVLSAAVLRKSQSYLCTSVDVLLIGASWVDERSDALLSEWSFSLEDIAEDPLLYTLTSPIPTCCSIVRIDKFRAVGGFDSSCRCWEDGDLHLRLVAHGARIAVMDDVLTTAIRHDRGASSNHLYCHRCRLAFLKRYAQQQLPIEPAAMANEFLAIGNLLLGERRYGEALEAFQLAHRAHPIQPKSNRALVRRLMAFLPPPLAIMLQQWLRQTLGQYFKVQK